ncbi:ecto-ADP-ribosyltransferase 5-like isoform X2 [Mauremys mutica]|uniref:ecto-ADP-ribosyltransferase 5-like isoform X2 n=1 Tax=Mauremys mutica TaxID=74926 RepID=UPI001D137FE3|nr:ecto-ADP-ribosyltransferase 5-like isoform X2 [Mauremys mutica]
MRKKLPFVCVLLFSRGDTVQQCYKQKCCIRLEPGMKIREIIPRSTYLKPLKYPHRDVGTMVKSLLIPLTYFSLQTCLGIPQAQCQVELSMMPDAFDDQYIGCAEEMDGIAPELLEKEKSMSSVFRTVWENAEKEWECVKKEISLPKSFEDEYGRAIVAYTDNDFHSELNAAVRGAGTSRAHYMASFQFKAFHYYLTRAIQLLRGRCDVMYNTTVYRGVSVSFQHTESGDIRFGHFASSSIKEEVAERYSTKNLTATPALFTIRTCFGVKIWNFSYSPPDEEVLIPVHEIFSVSQGQGSNSFDLRSTNRTCSHFNCAYLGGEKTQTCVYNSGSRMELMTSICEPSPLTQFQAQLISEKKI